MTGKKFLCKVSSMMLAAAMTVTFVPWNAKGYAQTGTVKVLAGEAKENPTSGECGDEAIWQFNAETGELIISGSGYMYDNAFADVAFKTDVKKVTIGNEIPSIGEKAFKGFTELKDVDFSNAEKLTGIGARSFSGCSALKSIELPASVEWIDEDAFEDTALTEITINNPECGIYGEDTTIPSTTKIIGYPGSYVHKYANKNNKNFEPLTDKEIKEIEVVDLPVLFVGESPSLDDAELKIIYNDGKEFLTSSDYSWHYDDSLMQTAGKKTVELTYYGKTVFVNIEVVDRPVKKESISVGTWKEINISQRGERYDLAFTPTVSGKYTFRSSGAGEIDPIGEILDGNGNQLAYNDDGDDYSDYNFCMTYDLTANTTYTMRTELLSDWATGKYNVIVELNNCSDHSYTSRVIKQATPQEAGTVEYTCKNCGAKYTDTIAQVKSAALSISSCTYNGKAQKPTVQVTDTNGKQISANDYSVSYQNNQKPGKATVTVSLRNQYAGTMTSTFIIKPGKASLKKAVNAKGKKIKATWRKESGVTGYEILYATNKKFTKGKKVIKISKASTSTKTIAKLKKKKTYYVKIRSYKTIDGKKVYGNWSNSKKVKIKK